MENLIELYPEYLDDAVALIKTSPITFEKVSYPMLEDQHCNIQTCYSDFFVEICCETFYSGNTFFPTEKTWRAIASGTPFIIQGPQWYLHNLRKLGFRTFDKWWDEGYSEDPSDWQPQEIIKVIRTIGDWSTTKMQKVYNDMKPVIDNNFECMQNLSDSDFKRVFEYE